MTIGRMRVRYQGNEIDYVLLSDYEELLAELERQHPKTVHLGFGIIGKDENGGNVWGPIDYGAGCLTCGLIEKARGSE